MPGHIEDYAIIGDCETAALVGRDGSIDWLCAPRFDSDACFAAILGNADNGRWQIAPARKARVTRRYRPGTLILETEFRNHDGTVVLIDFMPGRTTDPKIIRMVRGVRGTVQMHLDLVIRFDYGRTVPWVTRRSDETLVAIAGPHLIAMRADVPMRGENLRTISDFQVKAGDTICFELAHGGSNRPIPRKTNCKSALRTIERLWHKWISRCNYNGPFADAVKHSLLALKALTYSPTGGIIAAATTSLPEQPGGMRNWDYRYCWLRDATFTLLALNHAGFHKEARRWRNWLARSVAGSAEQVQVLYGVGGERHLLEWEVPWLSGHHGAAPVRVGNAAIGQFQLDIFGELADVLHQAWFAPGENAKLEFDFQRFLLERLRKLWRRPDHGIWEVRGPKQHFTHSKVMAWVAFDRAIKSSEQFKLEAPVEEWKALRQQIFDEVCRRGFDSQLDSFVQAYGSKEADASLLMLPLVGFLPATDPRILGTVRHIEKVLMRDGFVLRYETAKVDDGLPPGEGAFLPCSFWLADIYELAGRHGDAVRMLKRLLRLRNDVGLLSEEYHLGEKRLVGNFPQAFSHVGLINTILNIYQKQGPAHQRSASNHQRRRAR